MTGLAVVLGLVWAIGTVVTGVVGLMDWQVAYGRTEKHDAARLFLFCWAWPYKIVVLIRSMIRDMREELRGDR